jgi:hypothetical protein
MANEDWKLQVSYKTSTGDMINVRANTADELSVLLEGVSDYSTQIAATARMLNASAVVSPLATTTSTPAIAQESTFAPFQAQAPSATGPTCTHGARKFLSGVSKKNGKPYAMWVCPQPQGADQCSPVNG